MTRPGIQPAPRAPAPCDLTHTHLPVPDRHLTHPSIRDDVRRTLRRHKFHPHPTHYTPIHSIYNLYLSDTQQSSTSILENKFRSALGRVLRPPQRADAYAQSYAVPDLRRWNGYISIVSPDVKSVDPKIENRKFKGEMGRRCREEARVSDRVRVLREERRQRKESGQIVDDQACVQPVSFRYVDEFVALNCAEDLLRLKVFPNGKELAESMSAYSTVREYLHVHSADHAHTDGILSFKDPNVLLVAVGDGVTPRTASLFAFRTAWRCISIDPAMRDLEKWQGVSSLTVMKARVQDVTVKVKDGERVVVVMWHCHCGVADAVGCLEFEGEKWDCEDRARSRELRRRVAVVSCACCNYDAVQSHMPDGAKPDAEFEDLAVPGLMRTVRVWKYLK